MNFSSINKIVQITFEPIFSIMMLSVILLFWLYYKKYDKFFLTVAIGLLLMFIWRSSIILLSSRYGAIFLYPSIGLCAYFLYKLPYFCQSIMPRYAQVFEQKGRIISRVLVAILVMVCLVKNFHKRDNIQAINNMRELKQVLDKNDVVLSYNKPNYGLYLGMHKVESLHNITPNIEKLLQQDRSLGINHLKTALRKYKYCDNSVFFILEQNSINEILTSAELLLNEDESFDCISWEYESSKKDKIEAVYHYKSNSKPLEITNPNIPEFTKENNLMPYGNFEHLQSEEFNKKISGKMFAQNLIAYQDIALRQPRNISIFCPERLANPSEMFLMVTDNPNNVICDSYTLLFKTTDKNSFYCSALPSGDYRISFFAKADTSGVVELVVAQSGIFKTLAYIPVSKEAKFYTIELPYHFFDNANRFWLHFTVENSSIMIDNLMIIPLSADSFTRF